jgi:hypothetical protein
MGNLQQQRLVCEILVVFFLSWSRWTGNRPDHYALVIDLPSTIFKKILIPAYLVPLISLKVACLA